MGDRASNLFSGSTGAAWRAAVVNLMAIVFAAVLGGCTTKAQTRGAAQTTPVEQAPPLPTQPAATASAAPATPAAQSEAESAAPAVAFKDEGSDQVQEDAVAPETYAEEASAPVMEEAAPQQFTDSTAPTAEEETGTQSLFVDEQQPQDESTVAPERFVDEASATDEDTVPSQHFSDDEAPVPDENVAVQDRFSDEAPAQGEDSVAQQQFSDDAVPMPEEASPPPVFKDEVAEAAAEETAPAETFTDEAVAQADSEKPAQGTMLPLTISVEADSLFDFDKYSIRADSRHNLDDLVAKLESVSYAEIIAVGFADPIGSEKYNQRLSQRRAAAVKRYLVSKGIPADRIKTEGRGRTEEYASYKSCGGLRGQKLIACLQPNRRVEITVTPQEQR